MDKPVNPGALRQQHIGIDPLLEWNLLSTGDRLQLRFPDGRHVTFDRDGHRILGCLTALASGDLQPDTLTSALVEMLRDRRALSSIEDAGCDWAVDVYDYVFRRAGSSHDRMGRCDANTARTVSVATYGNGWAHDLVAESADLLGLRNVVDVDAITADSLLIVASNLNDPTLFSQMNARAVGVGARVLFVHRNQGRLVIGPLVIPGETACYACYLTRRRASAKFKDEFDSHSSMVVNPRARDNSPSAVAKGLCQSLIALHMLSAAAGAYDLIEPGTIYSFDIVTMEKLRQPILKVARCQVCSGYGGSPKHAVRAIA